MALAVCGGRGSAPRTGRGHEQGRRRALVASLDRASSRSRGRRARRRPEGTAGSRPRSVDQAGDGIAAPRAEDDRDVPGRAPHSASRTASPRSRAATAARRSELFPTPLSAYRSVSRDARRLPTMTGRLGVPAEEQVGVLLVKSSGRRTAPSASAVPRRRTSTAVKRPRSSCRSDALRARLDISCERHVEEHRPLMLAPERLVERARVAVNRPASCSAR